MICFPFYWHSRFHFGGHGNDILKGGRGVDYLFGFGGNDRIFGGGGNDYLNGGKGNDRLFGGNGHDLIFGGKGRDTIVGGRGDDYLSGGRGADRFVLNPNRNNEGDDRIKDFEIGTDKVVLNAVSLFRSDPLLFGADGDITTLTAEDFELSSNWSLSASRDGDLLISHPNGTIEFDNIHFGPAVDTFAELLPAIDITGYVVGDDGDNTLDGKGGRDVVSGGDGDDTIIGGIRDDILIGGDGMDRFVFDPSRENEGDDVIVDFDVTADKIVLNANDLVASDPDLLGADGDFTSLSAEDFELSPNWSLSASSDGDLLVSHPNGTIELDGIAFGPGLDTFAEVLPVIEVSGVISNGDGGGDTTGTDERDFISGGTGDDTIEGGAANDTIIGGAGNDVISGGADNDILVGGDGDDTLIGGANDDIFVGGAGVDRFVLDKSEPEEGNDVIRDFELGIDIISLSVDEILAGNPGIADADGVPGFSVTDLDASPDWSIQASDNGNVLFVAPTGTLEIEGFAFDPSYTFEFLSGFGLELVESEPVVG